MKKLLFYFFLIQIASELFPQHLPLQIGNQWHYDMETVIPYPNYAAIVVDTGKIDGENYFKIENRKWDTGELIEITYDTFLGDSLYIRIRNNAKDTLINFSWPLGFTRISSIYPDCEYYNVLINVGYITLWNVTSRYREFMIGEYCTGYNDTLWLLTRLQTCEAFGCIWGVDGWLKGAIINENRYGELYPLPVELLFFNSTVIDNNVTLNWQTATETNNSGFEVQRLKYSKNEKLRNWETKGFIYGNGTTTEPQTYTFVDENLLAGKYQYRLKQIDSDGTFEYSSVIEVEINSPTKFSLSQNFPNPFNPNTNIQYAISSRQFVTLKVFDVLGKEVATLVNEEKPAGSYEVEFQSSAGSLQLASGIYFYQLKAGDFIETKKMILMK